MIICGTMRGPWVCWANQCVGLQTSVHAPGWVVPPSETRCEYVPVSSSANVVLAKVSEGGTTHPGVADTVREAKSGDLVSQTDEQSNLDDLIFIYPDPGLQANLC